MPWLESVTKYLTNNSWAEGNQRPTESELQEIGQMFDGVLIDSVNQQIVDDHAEGIKEHFFDNNSTKVESQFVSVDAKGYQSDIWLSFLEKFNLVVYLDTNYNPKCNEISFEHHVLDNDIIELDNILRQKDLAFLIYKTGPNLYLFESNEISVINYNSNSPEFNPNEAVDLSRFESEDEKRIYLDNSALFVDELGNNTQLFENHNAIAESLRSELKFVSARYSKLVGRKIRVQIPFDIQSQVQLDILSLTVPLVDRNNYYLKFYTLKKLEIGYLVMLSLESYGPHKQAVDESSS